MYVRKIKPFNKVIEVDSDKSITHRALILGATASGKTKIYNPSICADCFTTKKELQKCGAKIIERKNVLEIYGGIKQGEYILDAENSGTTARLLMGLLSGIPNVTALLTGDESLTKRPMKRIVAPLKKMGASLDFVDKNGNSLASSEEYLPIRIIGKKLSGLEYSLPVASAQLKSALLLAGLRAGGTTVLSGEIDSRNHTEIMLSAFGARLKTYFNATQKKENKIILLPSNICGTEMQISGDFSSAIYFLTLALLNKDSKITVKNVNINPTRIAALELLQKCGANIYLSNHKSDIEQSADITASYSKLSPFVITSQNARYMIDELPILATIACFIDGKSVISGASELRLKESDRIAAITEGLTGLGAKIDILSDGMIINGTGELTGGGSVLSYCDHRIEMSLIVAAALSKEGGEVESGHAQISFPHFNQIFQNIQSD